MSEKTARRQEAQRLALEVELPRVGGPSLAPAELLSGGPSVLIFWSAVCSHCRRYDERLNAFEERRGLPLAVIACRAGETLQHLESARSQRGLDFALLLGTIELVRAFEVQQTPTAFLLGDDFSVLYRGAIDDFSYPDTPGHRAYLEDAILDHQSGRPIEQPSTPAFGCAVESVYYRWPKVVSWSNSISSLSASK